MESGIYPFILRHSRRDQVVLVLLSVAALPFLYYSFELPKLIVNEALSNSAPFPKVWLGLELGQLPYLFTLCAIFLALVLINGAFKFFTSTYRYKVGDRLLRRLRYQLVERLLRFPVGDFRNQSSGQVVSMVAAETSPLGFFMSEALTVPTVAAGTLFTILLFIFTQDWMMGMAAIALYPFQMYLIPRIQKRVNDLQRRESLAVRGVSDNVSQLISNAAEIHGNDTSQFELANITRRLQTIFDLRVRIASSRYTVNVLNQFFSQLTPFFFLSIGGFLVIRGEISLGSLVAVLAAHKDMYAPWKDLIDYYQKAEDARVKYGQLREYFTPKSLMAASVIHDDVPHLKLDRAELILSNVIVDSGDGVKSLDGATARLDLPIHAAFIGGTGNSRSELARLLLRQSKPTSGDLRLGELAIADLPDSVIGRRVAYAGSDVWLAGGTLRELLIYPLLRRPNTASPHAGEREATLTGNCAWNPDADWIDYGAAGCRDITELDENLLELLRATDLEAEVFDWGIRRPLQRVSADETARLLRARSDLRGRLQEAGLANAVEHFDPTRFLEGCTLGENIIFGTFIGSIDSSEHQVLDQHLFATLAESELQQDCLRIGLTVAGLMLEMFKDLDPHDAFFQDFNFIRPEDLPAYETMWRRAETHGVSSLHADGQHALIRLALQLTASRHTLGVVDDALRIKVLRARQRFQKTLPKNLVRWIVFFDPQLVDPARNLYENLLFGKAISVRPDTQTQIARTMRTVIEKVDLLALTLRLGMQFDTGIGASRLSVSQRQRIVLARCLIKRPDILILNEAFAGIEPSRRDTLLASLRQRMSDRTVLMIEPADDHVALMQRTFDIVNGRLLERTSAAGLSERGLNSRPSAVGLGGSAEIMAQIPLFAGIDRSKLKLLAFTSEEVTYSAGDVIFRQGDLGDRAYVILDGQVEVVIESTSSGESVVAEIGKHQIFGEMALLANRPRTTSIRAARDTRLLALRQDVFVRLVEEDAAIALGIARVLIDRLANTLQGVGKR